MAGVVRSEQHVYDSIKNSILMGQIAPGERLVIRNVAREQSVSAIPVLMALRMLERDGLVVNTPGFGAEVRRWSEQEIIDLYEMRKMHEGMACRLCAERATFEDMGRIVLANERVIETSMSMAVEENLQADINFHRAVVHGARSVDLARVVENLSIMECCMTIYWLNFNVPPIVGPETSAVHQPIVDAILSRNPEAAEWAGMRHVEDSLQRHRQLIRQKEGLGDGESRQGSQNTQKFDYDTLLKMVAPQ